MAVLVSWGRASCLLSSTLSNLSRHCLNTKHLRRQQHMPVMGIDTPQAVLSCTNKMQRIRRADRDAFAQRANGFGSTCDQAIGDRKPSPLSRDGIIGKLSRDFAKLAFCERAFTPLAMKNAGHLDAPECAAMHVSQGFGQLPGRIAFRLAHVKPGDVCGVELTYAQPRSSETDWVLSVTPLNLPSSACGRNRYQAA